MKNQKEFLDIRGVKRKMLDLQSLGVELKEVIHLLPDSVIKDYLLFETSKKIKLETTHDFYSLQNKISRMLDLVIRWDLGSKVLRLLEEIDTEIKKIVHHIEVDS